MSEALLKAVWVQALVWVWAWAWAWAWGWALISFSESKCHDYAAVTGYEVKTITGGMCMIKDPEKGWMSYAERVGRGGKR